MDNNQVPVNSKKLAGMRMLKLAESFIIQPAWIAFLLLLAIRLLGIPGFQPIMTISDWKTWLALVAVCVYTGFTFAFVCFMLRAGDQYDAGVVISGNNGTAMYLVAAGAWVLALSLLSVMLGTIDLGVLLYLLFLAAMQVVPMFAQGTLTQQARDEGKVLLNVLVLIAGIFCVAVVSPSAVVSAQTARVVPISVQKAVPTTVPVIAPTPKPEGPIAQMTPTGATKPFPPAGTVLTAAVGQYLWFEQPTGSGKFVEFKVNVGMFTGKEKLNGVCKVAGGDTFCQTDKTYSGNQTWWKVK